MENHKTRSVLPGAFKYSIPVLFGYLAIGIAFGLLMADAGFPWWMSLLMSLVMYAGSGQFIAVGLFAAGAGILEVALIQFVVNARHIAYSMSMLNRYDKTGPYKLYLIFGLTDETFALLSSLPETTATMEENERTKFMFYVTVLNQIYWITGSLIGAVAGSLIPFNTEGIGFALTAICVVLMIDKILAIRKPGVFIMSAIPTMLAAYFLPVRISILSALVISLVLAFVADNIRREAKM